MASVTPLEAPPPELKHSTNSIHVPLTYLDELHGILQAKDFSFCKAMKTRTALATLVMGLLALSLGLAQVVWWEGEYATAVRAEARRAATPYAEGLRVQLTKSVAAAFTIASLLYTDNQTSQGLVANFDTVAGVLRHTYGGISNLQLAPCGIVSQISPLAGNEQAIGHNLLASPDRVVGALETIRNRRLTFVGPVNLIQGGTAIIGRYPVFNNFTANCQLNNTDVPSNFWGYATMLTTLTDLVTELTLDDLTVAGYDWSISAPNWGIVAGSPVNDPENVIINFSDGNNFQFASWSLSIAPKLGWPATSPTLSWKLASLLLACTSGILTSYTLLFRNMVLGRALLFIDQAKSSGLT
jgi:hypothetical protein